MTLRSGTIKKTPSQDWFSYRVRWSLVGCWISILWFVSLLTFPQLTLATTDDQELIEVMRIKSVSGMSRVSKGGKSQGAVSYTLFDVYLDEDRPFIMGEASNAVVEGVGLLEKYADSTLTVETYCDQRNSKAYSLAVSHRRTVQVGEFLKNLEASPSKIGLVSYGSEKVGCPDRGISCSEEGIRTQFAFKYLAITRPKLGCLVRLGISGMNHSPLSVETKPKHRFLQKIKLAPVRPKSSHYSNNSLDYPKTVVLR